VAVLEIEELQSHFLVLLLHLVQLLPQRGDLTSVPSLPFNLL